jgi:hypothetical protein
MKRIISFFVLMLSLNNLMAQCASVTSIGNSTVVHASCPGNGSITVGTINPAIVAPSTDIYQYELRASNNTTVISPWQNSNVFNAVNAGTYSIFVRRVCASGPGAESSRAVTVSNTQTNLAFQSTAVTLQRLDIGCGTGRIQVNAQNANNTYLYALVSDPGAPNPAPTYVRAPRSSNVFDSLPAGTYYPRVINACGNAITTTFTVGTFANANLSKNANVRINPLGCDSVLVYISGLTNYIKINNTTDTSTMSLYVIYPNGTVDTSRRFGSTPATGYGLPTSGTTSFVSFNTHISNIDPNYNAALPFMDKITNWPLNFTVGFKDQCGNFFTQAITVQKSQTRNFSDRYDETSPRSTCDSIAYKFRIEYNNGPITYHAFTPTHGNFKYSLNGGTTWITLRTSESINTSNLQDHYTDEIVLLRGQTIPIMIDMCGEIVTRQLTTPAYPTYSPNGQFVRAFSCPGTVSYGINTQLNTRDAWAEVISGPTGHTLPANFLIKSQTNSNSYPPELANLVTGSYSLRIWDSIGVACPRSSIINFNSTGVATAQAMTISTNQDCDRNYLNIVGNADFSTPTLSVTQLYRVAIYDSTGQTVIIPLTLGTITTPSVTGTAVARINVSTLTNGVKYIIKASRAVNGNPNPNPSLPTCTEVELAWIKGNDDLNLNASRFVPGCPGASGSIVAIANGGITPYTFNLRDASNTIIPPSNAQGNIYNNLDTNSIYQLQVIDSCGTIITRSMNIGGNLTTFVSTHTLMPCPGDNVTLEMQNMPSVTYKWYKNNVVIPGATQYNLTIPNISNADAGEYKSEFTMNTCVVFSSTQNIDPTLCGMPLSVVFDNLNVSLYNNMPLLKWSTLSERNNAYFIVERSNSTINNWAAIGTVKSLAIEGNSETTLDYQYTDATTGLKGTYFYRIKQVDKDGNSIYSTIKQIDVNSITHNIRIYPNPTQGYVTLTGLIGSGVVEIYDVSGKVLQSLPYTQAKESLVINHLANGIYFIKVISEKGTTSYHKLIKE